MLLRAILLQAFYSIRSQQPLIKRLEFDLLFRWFVGLGVDEAVISARIKAFAQIARRRQALSQIGPVDAGVGGAVASAIEFIFEGLHLNKRLNKDETGTRATYRARA